MAGRYAKSYSSTQTGQGWSRIIRTACRASEQKRSVRVLARPQNCFKYLSVELPLSYTFFFVFLLLLLYSQTQEKIRNCSHSLGIIIIILAPLDKWAKLFLSLFGRTSSHRNAQRHTWTLIHLSNEVPNDLSFKRIIGMGLQLPPQQYRTTMRKIRN